MTAYLPTHKSNYINGSISVECDRAGNSMKAGTV